MALVLAAACGADGPDTVAESDLSSAESKDLEFATQPFDSEVDLGELIDDSVVGGLVFLRDQQLFSMSAPTSQKPQSMFLPMALYKGSLRNNDIC